MFVWVECYLLIMSRTLSVLTSLRAAADWKSKWNWESEVKKKAAFKGWLPSIQPSNICSSRVFSLTLEHATSYLSHIYASILLWFYLNCLLFANIFQPKKLQVPLLLNLFPHYVSSMSFDIHRLRSFCPNKNRVSQCDHHRPFLCFISVISPRRQELWISSQPHTVCCGMPDQ